MEEFDFVIVGGGIAGVSCAESLSFLCPEKKTALITASSLIKTVTNLVPLTKMLARFDVEEKSAETLSDSNPCVTVIKDYVTGLNSSLHSVSLKNGMTLKYKKLCICSGASPKLIPCESNKHVIGIRDTDSVTDFQKRVANSSRIVVVGNGGIATEIVHELTGVEIIWVIKDDHISATFIDPVAAEFFQDKALKKETGDSCPIVKRLKYTVEDNATNTDQAGAALGPDWHSKYNLCGTLKTNTKVTIEYKSEIETILTPEEVGNNAGEDKWPVFVKLTNGSMYGCDFIVSATGVVPCSRFELEDGKTFKIASDGGIEVDWKMQTNLADVYVAGDVCTASWERSPHWFQMRLWTQARQMGTYAAKSMVASSYEEDFYQDFCFEMFSHVTKFFGFKVVLLGLYNGQTLDNNYEVLLRITKGVEYIKLVMKNGRMQGAVLIGETDLEEMCENLILNQLDLTDFGEDLLNPNIDIEDYFD